MLAFNSCDTIESTRETKWRTKKFSLKSFSEILTVNGDCMQPLDTTCRHCWLKCSLNDDALKNEFLKGIFSDSYRNRISMHLILCSFASVRMKWKTWLFVLINIAAVDRATDTKTTNNNSILEEETTKQHEEKTNSSYQ